MARVSLVVLALALACTSNPTTPVNTQDPQDPERPPRIDTEPAGLDPGVLLGIEWSTGISGAGLADAMVIQEDGVVRYVAIRKREVKLHRGQLPLARLAELRATLDGAAFAAVGDEYLAPTNVHDAGFDELVVATKSGARTIRVNDRFGKPPGPLVEVLAIVEEAHALFADVNPWNTDW